MDALTVGQKLADTVPYGVTLWKAESESPGDLRLVYVNPQASREAGFDLELFVGRTVSALVTEEARADRLAAKGLQAAIHRKLGVLPRYRPPSARGEGEAGGPEFQVHLVPVWDRTVAVVYRQLHDAEEKSSSDGVRLYFQDVVRTLHEPLAVVDTSLELVWANPSFLDQFGLAGASGEGGSLSSVGGGALADRRLSDLLAEGSHASAREIELTLETAAKGQRLFQVHAQVLRGASASPRLLLLALRDLTDERKMQQQRRHLLRKLVELRDADRRALALELHDQLGQSVTAMSVTVEQLLRKARNVSAPASVQAQLEGPLGDLQGQLAALARNVNRISRGLHPFALEELGFEAAALQLVEEARRLHGLRASLVLTGFDGRARLPAPIALALYRMLQEALSNVVRHARCEVVSVTAHRDPTRVRLIVEDDGTGFDPDASARAGAEPRLGLVSLRERAGGLGGSLELESAESGGTTLVATLPLL